MQTVLPALFVIMVGTSCNVRTVSLLKAHPSVFPHSLGAKSRLSQSNIISETCHSIHRFFIC